MRSWRKGGGRKTQVGGKENLSLGLGWEGKRVRARTEVRKKKEKH